MHSAIVRAKRRCVVRGSPASVCTSVANCCNLRAGCCRTVCMGWCKTRGKVHRSFEIHSAWSVCSAVRTVLLKDARQMHAAVDPGCNKSVQQMCEHPNFGRVLVATEVTALWRRSGDRRALRTLELLAMELRTKDSGLSVGRKLVNCQREIFHKQTCGQPTMHICGLGVRTNPLARGTLPRTADPALLE